MKTFVVVCFLAVAGVTLARPDQYTNKYDNVNLEEILKNRRLLVPYVKCILDQGKCTPDGKELQSHIQEALENDCGNCTDTQKSGTRRVIKHLINKESEFWKQLCDKYDPDRKYTAKYEKELQEVSA